jgi:hypothetical protein
MPAAKTEPAGRITGMVDCQWADESTATMCGAHVPLGRKYALRSGFVEITYNTGAQVVLQGPATYEVESTNGGRLQIGKLVGKVEAETAKGFCIHTPAATVTDLGTEFGVEVDKHGFTTSHVFRGSVELRVVDAGGEARVARHILHEDESVLVETAAGASGGNRVEVLRRSAGSAGFVREIPKRTVASLDLVDIVAGGDGTSGRRGRGIDSRNGRTSNVPSSPKAASDYLVGDYKYHRVETLPLVDGVFIPDGRSGPVQIDFAGHVFDGFGATSNLAAGQVWAMEANPPARPRIELNGVNYGSPDHTLLYLPANNGVTFDLVAIRQANPGCKVRRFRAVAANTEKTSAEGAAVSADVWVLVDGQVRFRRREINGYSGAFPVLLTLNENDRFLTLAVTDGGNGIEWDWIMFGDPRLELTPTDQGGGSVSLAHPSVPKREEHQP